LLLTVAQNSQVDRLTGLGIQGDIDQNILQRSDRLASIAMITSPRLPLDGPGQWIGEKRPSNRSFSRAAVDHLRYIGAALYRQVHRLHQRRVQRPAATPSQPHSNFLFWISSGTTRPTMLTGMAKPTPLFTRLPSPVSIWAFTPITSPCRFSSGPPELPGLIGASVWIAWEWKKRPAPDRAADRADDPARQGAAQAKWVADGEDGLTTATWLISPSGSGRIPSGSSGFSPRPDRCEGHADDFGFFYRILIESDFHGVSAMHDVGVSDNMAKRVKQKSGTLAGRL